MHGIYPSTASPLFCKFRHIIHTAVISIVLFIEKSMISKIPFAIIPNVFQSTSTIPVNAYVGEKRKL